MLFEPIVKQRWPTLSLIDWHIINKSLNGFWQNLTRSKYWMSSLYPPQTKFGGGVYRNHPVCLSVCLSVCSSVQSKLNLDHNFLTKGDKGLILYKCIPCDKTFLSIPKFLTSWPWPWLLTYFWKNLTLAITFEPKEIGLSYFTCVFVVTRPFCWYQNFWLRDLDLDFWPTFEKT